MNKEKNQENLNDSFSQHTKKYLISNQDNIYPGFNQQNPILYISKKEKEFITQNNKLFYKEFKILFRKNIELKNKLNEINTEKKRLYDIIIKKEQIFNNFNTINKDNLNKDNISISFIPYNKKKRIRRPKNEINNIYNCSFPNCDKSYPTKCSLNMHIKLKHHHLIIDENNK